MASSSGIFLWIAVSGTGEFVEKTAEEATSLLLQGTFDPGMSARLAGDERTTTLSALLEWLDFVHGTRLQLTGRIDTESVRASFRRLSRQYHPDHTETLGPDLQALAETRFKEINESKSYLLARLDSGLDSLVIGSDVAEPQIPPPAVSPSLAPNPAAAARDRGFRDDGKRRRTPVDPRQPSDKPRRGFLGPLAAVIGLVAFFLWLGDLFRTGSNPPVVESDTTDSSPPSTEPPTRVVDYGERAKTSPANPPPDDESTPGQKPSAAGLDGTKSAPKVDGEIQKPKAVAAVGPADPSNESKGASTPMSAGGAIDPAVDPEVAAILAEYERSSREASGESFEQGLAEPRQVAIAKLEKRLESATREGALALALSIRSVISRLGPAVNRSGSGASEQSTPTGFSYIPGGSFTMGATSGDTDRDAPSITVTVSPFYLQQTETTKAQWDEVRTWAVSKGYTDLAAGAGKASNHPVQTVSWWDVVKWCNARSEKEGLTPVYTVSGAVMRTGRTEPTANWSANGYRLPTEAEWEKAARGGVIGKRFPWGTDTISHTQANFNNSGGEAYVTGTTIYHPSYKTGNEPYTSPVGSFGANGYGLYDMSGNVWEWCWDWYGGSHNRMSNGTTDPRGPAWGTNRVNRGGSWYSNAIYARCVYRHRYSPGYTYNFNGFRPARSSVP